MVNSLPDDKISALTKFKAFSDNLNIAKIAKLVFDIVENIVDKGENAGNQHCSFSHYVFKSPLPSGLLKARIVG